MNTHVRERESHARRLFIEVTPELRRVLEMVAEAAIDALDQIDGDPDLEPSFGLLPPGVLDETELDADEEEDDEPEDGDFGEDDGCDEPSLGAPESRMSCWGQGPSLDGNQSHWAAGGGLDLEDEDEHGGDIQDEPHDGLDEDGCEPSLGALEFMATQLGWAFSDQRDLEHDDSDDEDDGTAEDAEPSGIGDLDGLYEQVEGVL
jgi:hypothetical protein